MADRARARRLAKRIAQIVATALEHEIKDPRLSGVTVTDARLTADLRDATVYYTVRGESLDAAPDVTGAAAALSASNGVLRSKVGAQLGVRHTPALMFVADTVPEDARRIEELLNVAQDADAEVARQATSAEHAGDADPYRADPDASDDGDE